MTASVRQAGGYCRRRGDSIQSTYVEITANVKTIKRRDFIVMGASAAGGLAVAARSGLAGGALAAKHAGAQAKSTGPMLENDHFSLTLDEASGALSSLVVKRNKSELIEEKRLLANFRICLPLPDCLCNYIDGMTNAPVQVEKTANAFNVRFSGLKSEKGAFPLDLSYTITLAGDQIRFRARLTNWTKYPVSEFWFPRLGGWTNFNGRDALLAMPGYQSCRHEISLFRGFPDGRPLGAEAAEFSVDYPGLMMPWLDLHDGQTDSGLYLGYHDKIFRFSTWHVNLFPDKAGRPGDAWLTAQEAAGEPVGLVFSHVRYPFIATGETFDAGEFIIRVHRGDWHRGSQFYRRWFMENFPFDKSKAGCAGKAPGSRRFSISRKTASLPTTRPSIAGARTPSSLASVATK